jgi:hypothetical protein
MRSRLAAFVLAGASLCCCATASAAPFGVQIGRDKLVLDTPVGFADSAAFGSPRLTEIAETLADASNRVLVFALSDADVRRFGAGDSLELRRYLLAVTPKARERDRISEEQFAELVADTEKNVGAPPASADFMAYLKGRPAGQSHLLAQLRREPQVLSLLSGTMIPHPPATFWRDAPPPSFKISTMSIALIGGRALYVSAFSAYDSPADVAWIRSVTERWVDDLRRLNR